MPDEHARLSPSASDRWLSCPASTRMEDREEATSEESVYAMEGTAAHALGELQARHQILEEMDAAAYTQAYEAWMVEYGYVGKAHEHTRLEMNEHAQAYVNLLRERLAAHPHSILFLEQRMDTGLPNCWGTSDAVIVSLEHVEIVDLKYGQGVAVSAEENSQLKLYGLGALDTYGDLLGDADTVYLTVFQPRIGDGHASTWSLPADALRAWREEIRPIAEQALHDDDAPFGPSPKACRWCPAAGFCRARMEKSTQDDFGSDPDRLSPEEIGEILPRLKEIRSWCAAVENHALDLAYSKQTQIPGFKVVLKGGRRYVTDPAAAIQTLIDAGHRPEEVADFKIKGFGVLEKLVGGRKAFDETLGRYVNKTTPSPSLVPESDPGTPISPSSEAAKDFQEES